MGSNGADELREAYELAVRSLGRVGVPFEEFEARVEALRAGAPAWGELHLQDLYLAMGCQAGDERAWRLLHDTYHPRIALFGGRFLGSRDAGEELASSLFEALVHSKGGAGKIHAYEGWSSLGRWLKVLAWRMAVDEYRSTRRRAMRDSRFAASVEPDRVHHPEDQVAEAERRTIARALLDHSLDALEPNLRLAMKLNAFDGLGVREVARVMGVDPSTVSRWLAKARRRMERTMRREGRRRFGMEGQALVGLLVDAGWTPAGQAETNDA